MGRVFLRATPDGSETLEMKFEELDAMKGFFSRSGIAASTISKLTSENDEVISSDECTAFAKRIQMMLGLRMVIWSEAVLIQDGVTKSMTPKLITRSIDRPMRTRCMELATFLGLAATNNGCFLHSGLAPGSKGRSSLK